MNWIIAQTTQSSEPIPWVWTNLSTPTILAGMAAFALVYGAGIDLLKSAGMKFIDAIFGLRLSWRTRAKELEEKINANTQGVSELIDINKVNPNTPDVSPVTEAKVKEILTGAGDGGPPKESP